MFHGIYKLNDKAIKRELDIDTACALNLIELVEDFDSYGDALDALVDGCLKGKYNDQIYFAD